MSDKPLAPGHRGLAYHGSQAPSHRQPVHPLRHLFFPHPRTSTAATRAVTARISGEVELSRTGHIWSYTNACYQPPAPFVAADPFEPYAIAGVQLERGTDGDSGPGGQGRVVEDLKVGMPMELVLETLHETEDDIKVTWKWRPLAADATSRAGSVDAMSNEIAIIGAGMHPWGKWGHNFVQYGVAAAREALADAGVPWQDIRFVSGGATVRCGYPGYVAGATFAQALGWQGAEVNTSYAACASGSQALAAARNKILAGECEVALVVGADTTPKGFLAPAGGYRPEDPDWVRFYLGITNPTYFALYARRTHGPVRRYPGGFRRGQGQKLPGRRKESPRPLPQVLYRGGRGRLSHGGRPPAPDGYLRHQRRRRGPDRLQPGLRPQDRQGRRTRGSRPSPPSPPPSPAAWSKCPISPPIRRPRPGWKPSLPLIHPLKAYEEAGIGPEDVSLAEVYDLSTALELDWIEDLRLAPRGEAAALLRQGDTALGGRIPVNVSGGLACFGEAVPAQAIAQVCELTWQLRGEAGDRQVKDAKVGITANQGLFGHGSSVIVKH